MRMKRHVSLLSRLDARLKMALAFGMSIVMVLADNLPLMLAGVLVGLLVFFLCRPSWGQVKLVVFSCLLLMWGIVLSQGLFYARFPRHAMVVLLKPNGLFPEGLKIYAQGLHYGLLQSLRMVAMGLMGYAICFSTEPDRFLRGLIALRVPYSLAFMAVSAIRFIPIAAREFQIVRTAMRLKGYKPFRRGLRDTIRTEIAGLRPILANTIRRSQEIALSVQARGFSLDPTGRTQFYEMPMAWWQIFFLIVVFVLVATIALLKVLFWLYRAELYYHPRLREIYWIVREML